MKWLNSDKMKMVFVGIVAALVLSGGNAKADFTFGEPTNPGPAVNSSGWDSAPSISADGLELYFTSFGRSGGVGGGDIWVTTRRTTQDEWESAVNLGPVINSSSEDAGPCVSYDGLELYFNSERPGGYGGLDLYVATRKTKEEPWDPPVNLGPVINTVDSACEQTRPHISSDGLSLFFSDGDWLPVRPGGQGLADIWVTTRIYKQAEWGVPVNLGPPVNTAQHDTTPSLSCDGLLLFFGRGSFQAADIWLSRRKTTDDLWEEPVKLGLQRGDSWEGLPCISPDGSTLYWTSYARPGGFGSGDIWQVSIEPLVDFNGDGSIDTEDLLMLINCWGTDDSLYDIGPMPWGDGVVDIEDLTIFMKYWEQENMP